MAGAVRAHGQTGAFVSQWTVHLNTLQVKAGQDLIERIWVWNGSTYELATDTRARLSRLCSADLPALTAFYNPATGNGFDARIFTDGEESGNEGRAFAHIASGAEKGNSYELPSVGRFSWENAVAHPNAGDRTILVGMDDSTPGQVYVYVGTKRAVGNAVERAGLAGGTLFGVKVSGVPFEDTGAIAGSFSLEDVSGARASGATLQAYSRSVGVTEFARPEDGAWDTQDPRAFYFVTTGATVNGRPQTSRLYKLTFDTIENPTGGTIQLVLDSASLTGNDGQVARFFDNITVARDGAVLVQEDPGNQAYIAKTWRVDPVAHAAIQVLESDRARFRPGVDPLMFLTQDEENSGIIEVTDIVRNARWFEEGRRYFLAVMQAHYDLPGLVEGGQLYLVASPRQ